jgi:hypothetical protein
MISNVKGSLGNSNPRDNEEKIFHRQPSMSDPIASINTVTAGQDNLFGAPDFFDAENFTISPSHHFVKKVSMTNLPFW